MKKLKRQQTNNPSTLQNTVDDLKSVFPDIDVQEEKKIKESIGELEEVVQDRVSNRNELLLRLFFVLVSVSISFCVLFIDRNNVLKDRIEILEQRDSLYREILGSDTTGAVSYRVRDNKPITYHEMAIENDVLHGSVDSYKKWDSLLCEIMGVSEQGKVRYYTSYDKIITYEDLATENSNYIEQIYRLEQELDSLRQSNVISNQLLWKRDGRIIYLVKSNRPISYEELATERDSLLNRIDKLSNDLSLSEKKLNLITKQFPIEIVCGDGFITLKSEQLDSALVLLPYYRDRLSYDPEKQLWRITVK